MAGADGSRLGATWFVGDLKPWRATVVGIVGVLVIELVLRPLNEDLSRATEGLTLVVPVIVAAVMGGQRAAYATAATATLAYSLLIPPVGTPRIELTEDVVALVVFFVVALVVSVLVSRRVEALDRVEHQRRALLRSVSHDLRTPLSVIRAASTELAGGETHDEATTRRMLELIGDESERLDRLVANLLSMSRIEAGALQPNRQSVDLGELVVACTSRLGRLLAGVTFELEMASDLPPVSVDFTLMEQVVTNLLENAVRHSPPDGVVSLRVERRRDVHLVVTDEGPGLDPSESEILFEPFRSGALAGTGGVGLAICKAVVEAHGGTIAARAAESGGAEFDVSLPV